MCGDFSPAKTVAQFKPLETKRKKELHLVGLEGGWGAEVGPFGGGGTRDKLPRTDRISVGTDLGKALEKEKAL